MRLEFPKNKVELYEIELPEVAEGGKNRVRTWLPVNRRSRPKTH